MYLFAGRDYVPYMPVGGMLGGGDQLDQPPGSLCAPLRAGRNCDPGGGQPTLPLLAEM